MSSLQPVVSIILPTYNRVSSLSKAIDSVISQTLDCWELIIVDDCSTIDVVSHIRPMLSERIRYLRTLTNGGPSAARNLGIRNANEHSRYISLLDDDDAFQPGFLKMSLERMENCGPEIGFCWTSVRYVYPEKGTSHIFFWNPGFKDRESAYRGFLEKRLIGTGYGITFRKEVFTTVGYFDETLKAVVDTDFFLRVLRQYFYTSVPELGIDIYRHAGEKVNKVSLHRIHAMEVIVQKHQKELVSHFQAWFNFRSKILSMYYTLGNKRSGRNYIVRVLRERFSMKLLLNFFWLELKYLAK